MKRQHMKPTSLWERQVLVDWKDLNKAFPETFTPKLYYGNMIDMPEYQAQDFGVPYEVFGRELNWNELSSLARENALVYINAPSSINEAIPTHELRDILDSELMLSDKAMIVNMEPSGKWLEVFDPNGYAQCQIFILALTDEQYDNLSYLNFDEITSSVRGIVDTFKEEEF